MIAPVRLAESHKAIHSAGKQNDVLRNFQRPILPACPCREQRRNRKCRKKIKASPESDTIGLPSTCEFHYFRKTTTSHFVKIPHPNLRAETISYIGAQQASSLADALTQPLETSLLHSILSNCPDKSQTSHAISPFFQTAGPSCFAIVSGGRRRRVAKISFSPIDFHSHLCYIIFRLSLEDVAPIVERRSASKLSY